MKVKGKDLEFICRIKTDGSGTLPVFVESADMSLFDDVDFTLLTLSGINKTFTATAQIDFIVRKRK